MEQLMQHPWPGNIRELEHTMEKTVILSDQVTISDIALTPGAELIGNQMTNATLNLEEHEKMVIGQALKEEKGNVSSTAKALGINRSTLYQKMKKYGL
jgi:transcriptional regulator of acetoin/glycerol metabolism